MSRSAADDADAGFDRGIQDLHQRLQRLGYGIVTLRQTTAKSRYDGLLAWDMTLSKNWYAAQALRLQFRV